MSENHYKNIAIIVAGGSGSRFGGEVPKQYSCIGNRTLLSIVVEKFVNHKDIDAVIVGINDRYLDLYQKSVDGLKVLPYCNAGEFRQDTVRNCLESIKQYNPKNVLIHDAARILIEDDVISNLLVSLKDYSAAISACKVQDTLKYSGDGVSIEKTIDRHGIFMAQTPQAFDYDLILSLHIKYQGCDYSDDSLLCEKDGVGVRLIESSLRNFKITTKEDFELAKFIIRG